MVHKFVAQLSVTITMNSFFVCRMFKLDILHPALAPLYWMPGDMGVLTISYRKAGGKGVQNNEKQELKSTSFH